MLKVDNAAVRAEQVGKARTAEAPSATPPPCEAALAALSEAARGTGNLLAASVEAARAGATVGEMSAALERVFGRHAAEPRALSGIYAKEAGGTGAVERAIALTAEFERNEGRKPKILVAKMGQDGHDRGQKVIASAFADLGFEVAIGPLFSTPEETARLASREATSTSSAYPRSPRAI